MPELTVEALDRLIKLSQAAIAKPAIEANIIDDIGGVDQLLLTADGIKPVPDDWLEAPRRAVAGHEFIEVDSFCEYVNSFKEPRSRIYGSLSKGTFTCVLDDHSAGLVEVGVTEPDDGTEPKSIVTMVTRPSHRSHRVMLDLTPTKDWKAWSDVDGEKMSQCEFAEFLETMDHTIIEPDGATLIEAVERLQLTSDYRLESKIDRTSGAVTLNYVNDVRQEENTKVKLPTRFFIAVSPYRSVDPVNIEAFLRYRPHGGHVSFVFQLRKLDDVLTEAFENVATEVAEKTGIKPLIVH